MIRKIRLSQGQKQRSLPAVVFGAFNRLLTRQKACSRPSSVILVEQNRIPPTNWFRPRKRPIANPSKSHTTRQKFLTTNCSTSTGGKLIRPKPTDSSPILVPAIALRFFTKTATRKKSRKLQKRSSRTPANSKNRLSRK